jgi:NAD(P)-dependent dehydrogenase (short-subunit alcohol dehydrogenase family)
MPSRETEPQRPPQHQQRQPGLEFELRPQPRFISETYKAADKLAGKIALITGGDSGIGRATAVAFAREGADVVIAYLSEHRDAEETRRLVVEAGRSCLLLPGDVGDPEYCRSLVETTLKTFGRIDVVVNNAAEQHPQDTLTEISDAQLESTFRTNVFGMFYLTRAALPHLRRGGTIINTTSVVAYRGSPHLIDYAATKGAIVAFTRSMAQSVAERGIRVNAVAPGPIWTPLIAASFDAEHVATFGADTLMRRAGEPAEVAPCFVFLACDDSSYMTGQVLHPNGGDTMSG